MIVNISSSIHIKKILKLAFHNPVDTDNMQMSIYSNFMLSTLSFLFKVTVHRLHEIMKRMSPHQREMQINISSRNFACN